jgi:quercetin dioxygenase-like cupin family protein
MDIQSFSKNIDFKGRSVSTSVILETPFSKEIRIAMKRDHLIKEHQTPFPIVVHLLEGEIDFGVEGRGVRLEAGDAVTLAGGVPHDLKALTDSRLRLTISKHDSAERVKKVIKNT